MPSNDECLPQTRTRKRRFWQILLLIILILAMMMGFTAGLTTHGVSAETALACAAGIATITLWLVRRVLTVLNGAGGGTDDGGDDPIWGDDLAAA
jgi:hypothetical protein